MLFYYIVQLFTSVLKLAFFLFSITHYNTLFLPFPLRQVFQFLSWDDCIFPRAFEVICLLKIWWTNRMYIYEGPKIFS